jgi:PEGA domain-containing protein
MVMKLSLWLACSFLAIASAGCVERRFLITSEVACLPPGEDAGAMLYVNGEQIGPTPHVYYYTYYGKYHLTLVKDGFETLQVDQCIPAPWYEWPPLDFFAENVDPFKIRDVRTFNYALQPLQVVPPGDVLTRGQELRTRGQTIMPLPDSPPPPPKPAPTPKPEPPPLVPGTVAPTLGNPRPLPPQ